MKRSILIIAFLGILFSCGKNTQEAEILVSSVSLSQPTAEMIIGETIQLTATVLPSNASQNTITWASSKASVATVEAGRVTAIAEGAATITASTGGKSATCTVTVSKGVIAVTSVELNKTSLDLVEGDSETLVATVKPDDATDKTVTWSTSDKTIATVENGKVTAVKEGEATITAKAGEKSATCKVTVAKKVIPVESVTLNKTELALTKGQSETLTATVSPEDATDKTVTWSSSDETIASVTQNGLITALKSGETIITAKAGEKSATCKVTIKTPVESVSLDRTSVSLEEGQTTKLVATINPNDADEKTVEWSTSSSSIATVTDGVVSAVAEGTATITAKAGGKSATCEVTVKKGVVAVSSVTLNKATLSLTKGQSETLTATVAPDDATDKTVTWSSSDATIATVENGKVTAMKIGEATITVTTQDGNKTATCSVTVKYAVPQPVDLGLSVNWASFNVGATKAEEFGDYFAWGETSPKNDYWWTTYELCNGSSSTLTKYNNDSNFGTVDNKTEFKDYDYEEDAARQAFGAKWRMPTAAEWAELQEKCTWTWTNNYNGTGIEGTIITASNGNSIFLPAAGCRIGTNINDVSSYGFYWSSSLRTYNPLNAWSVYFSSGDVGVASGHRRCDGISVRPVSD